MKYTKKIFFTIILSFLIFTLESCEKSKLQKTKLTIKKADKTEVSLIAEIAKTPKEREFGFMERKNIPDGTGMIFVFEKDQILSFWMKNTPHPLSIAYIDSNGKIRNLYDMTPFSLSPVVSTNSVRYALEVPQGWFAKEGITIGDFVDISNFN